MNDRYGLEGMRIRHMKEKTREARRAAHNARPSCTR